MNFQQPIQPVTLPGEEAFELLQPDGDHVRGYFHDSGRGPVGVFVHGFRSHCNGEKSLAVARHAREQGWSWLRFDLRGHGLSGGDLARQNVTSALSDLHAVFEYTAGRELILLGSSMGGWISTLASLGSPQRVLGMVLIAPAFNFVQRNFATLPAEVLALWKHEGRMSFPDAYDREPYTLEYSIIEDAWRYDVLDRAVEIDMPVHIVHGDDDSIVPLASTHQFIANARAENLELEVIPGGDHRLMEHLELIICHLDRVWLETES